MSQMLCYGLYIYEINPHCPVRCQPQLTGKETEAKRGSKLAEVTHQYGWFGFQIQVCLTLKAHVLDHSALSLYCSFKMSMPVINTIY